MKGLSLKKPNYKSPAFQFSCHG